MINQNLKILRTTSFLPELSGSSCSVPGLHLNFLLLFKKVFSLLVSVHFFVKLFLQVYVRETGEGTSPILTFLHHSVMIGLRSRNSAERDIGYISSKRGTE